MGRDCGAHATEATLFRRYHEQPARRPTSCEWTGHASLADDNARTCVQPAAIIRASAVFNNSHCLVLPPTGPLWTAVSFYMCPCQCLSSSALRTLGRRFVFADVRWTRTITDADVSRSTKEGGTTRVKTNSHQNEKFFLVRCNIFTFSRDQAGVKVRRLELGFDAIWWQFFLFEFVLV